MSEINSFPRISLVTPSYNRAGFIDRTIQSVLSQNYPELDYIIVDGNSTDGTVDIIKSYADQLSGWISEPDNGMYDAIQKGFDRTDGEIMGWLNSDDLHFDWTLHLIAKIFTLFPQVDWLTTTIHFGVDRDDVPIYTREVDGYSRDAYYKGEHLPIQSQPFKLDYIMQEGTFWRRSLWKKAGSTLDTSLKYAGESDLWFRFFQHATLYDIAIPLAKFRIHDEQISSAKQSEYEAEVESLFQKHKVQRHSTPSAFLRRIVHHNVHPRLRGLALKSGLLYEKQQIRFRPAINKWLIEPKYY